MTIEYNIELQLIDADYVSCVILLESLSLLLLKIAALMNVTITFEQY